MSDNIIIFPDFERLRDEVAKMRAELSMLVLERDELRFVICRNIETAYMLALGALEYKVYEAQCAFLRLKRKAELIQARINRQEKIVQEQIERILDEEFAAYQAKLDEQLGKMNAALERSQLEQLTPAENQELKKLYHRVVKALHPDLHPELSEEHLELFKKAVTAYENGDLETLRIIDEMTGDPLLSDEKENAMAQLAREKERLTTRLNRLRDSIDQIKNEYPYTYKELINDEQWIAETRDELTDLLQQYQAESAYYQARIKEISR